MMRNRRRRDGSNGLEVSRLWTLATIASALLGSALHVRAAQAADGTPPATSTSKGRELGDHLFLLTPLIRDPFATTYFDMRTIEGLASAQGPLFNPSGMRTGTRDYTLAAV